MRMVTFGKSRVIRRDRVRRQGLGIVALCPFYSCWVESGGLGDPVASRAWCVQAAVMLACPAVLEDPGGEPDRGCQVIWLWPSGRFRRIL